MSVLLLSCFAAVETRKRDVLIDTMDFKEECDALSAKIEPW